MNIDELAQAIRTVDGSNVLGAGALAEALMPLIEKSRRHHPDAERYRHLHSNATLALEHGTTAFLLRIDTGTQPTWKADIDDVLDAACGVPPSPVSEEVQVWAIKVEKRLCELLGWKWTPRVSIDDLCKAIEQRLAGVPPSPIVAALDELMADPPYYAHRIERALADSSEQYVALDRGFLAEVAKLIRATSGVNACAKEQR
jgi:hypothetical protein